MLDRPAVARLFRRELRALAKRLRDLREQRGLTQEQAAEKIGVHPKHLTRMEAGAANVTFAVLVACAFAYRVELVSLFAPTQRENATVKPPARES